MNLTEEIINLIFQNKIAAVISFLILFAVIAFSVVFASYIRNPFSFPYKRFYVDVTGKRNVIREDVIDTVLLKKGIDKEIVQHEDYIRKWHKWCKVKADKSLFKRRRKKQLKSVIPQKDEFYCFIAFRSRKKRSYYRGIGYHYTRRVTDSNFHAGAKELQVRLKALKKHDFKGTIGELNRKQQRSLMTPALRKQIMERDNFTCQICGRYMPGGFGIEIDHIVPVAKGGLTTPDNLQVLCTRCNRRKSDSLKHKQDIFSLNTKIKMK